jgi:hypothetical protein
VTIFPVCTAYLLPENAINCGDKTIFGTANAEVQAKIWPIHGGRPQECA